MQPITEEQFNVVCANCGKLGEQHRVKDNACPAPRAHTWFHAGFIDGQSFTEGSD